MPESGTALALAAPLQGIPKGNGSNRAEGRSEKRPSLEHLSI